MILRVIKNYLERVNVSIYRTSVLSPPFLLVSILPIFHLLSTLLTHTATSQTLPIPLFSSTPTESELDATPSSSVMPPPACPPPKKSSSDETTATSSSGDYWYKTKVFNTLQRDQSGSSLEDHSGREQLPTIMEVQGMLIMLRHCNDVIFISQVL